MAERLTTPLVPKNPDIIHQCSKAPKEVVILGTINFRAKLITGKNLDMQKRDTGSSGGWRRKVATHDDIKKGFGCEALGCDICNYRKTSNPVDNGMIKNESAI